MKLSKIIFLISFVLILMYAFSLYSQTKDAISIYLASPFKQGHPLVDAAEKFKEIIEEKSKGKIVVEISAGVLTEEQCNTECSKGRVDIQATGGRAVEVFAPKYFFINAPYVIKDYDHLLRVWNGKLGQEAQKLIDSNGNMISLGLVYRGNRQMTSNKPINNVNDLKDLKLRLPVVETWVTIWKEIGSVPVPVPLTELYNSLKDGRADASEGDLGQISSFKLNEVQNQLTITNHVVGSGWVLINKNFFKTFSKVNQNLIVNSMKTACEYATKKFKDGEDALLADLEKKGMKINKNPDAASIREKAKPAVENLFKSTWNVTTWDEVLKQ